LTTNRNASRRGGLYKPENLDNNGDKQRAVFKMFGLIFTALGLILGYYLLRIMQDRPTDRPTIENFAKQNSLRIISMKRLNPLLLFRLLISTTARRRNVSGTARVYDVVVADSEDNHGSVYVAFDPQFSSQMDVVDSHGLALVPPSGINMADDVIQ
jgi:hypothetical protein